MPTVAVEGGEAMFGWAEGNPQYELSVARRGTAPDSGIVIATTDTTYSLAGLDSGVWYSVRVRAACDRYDSLWWSDWSLPTNFYLGTINPDSLGIAAAWAEQFTLSPNPAAGQVTVSASQGIKMIEVYDTRGAKIYSQTMATDRWTLTTEEWPAGQYIVTVETAAGTTSKLLSLVK